MAMNPLDWDLGNVPPGIAWGGVDGGTRSRKARKARPDGEPGPVDRAIAGGQRLHHPAPSIRGALG
jgi:hypothetical protein